MGHAMGGTDRKDHELSQYNSLIPELLSLNKQLNLTVTFICLSFTTYTLPCLQGPLRMYAQEYCDSEKSLLLAPNHSRAILPEGERLQNSLVCCLAKLGKAHMTHIICSLAQWTCKLKGSLHPLRKPHCHCQSKWQHKVLLKSFVRDICTSSPHLQFQANDS